MSATVWPLSVNGVAAGVSGGSVAGRATRIPPPSPTLRGVSMAAPPPQLLPTAPACPTTGPQPGIAAVRGTPISPSLGPSAAQPPQAVALAQLSNLQQTLQQGCDNSQGVLVDEGDDNPSGCRQQ